MDNILQPTVSTLEIFGIYYHSDKTRKSFIVYYRKSLILIFWVFFFLSIIDLIFGIWTIFLIGDWSRVWRGYIVVCRIILSVLYFFCSWVLTYWPCNGKSMEKFNQIWHSRELKAIEEAIKIKIYQHQCSILLCMGYMYAILVCLLPFLNTYYRIKHAMFNDADILAVFLITILSLFSLGICGYSVAYFTLLCRGLVEGFLAVSENIEHLRKSGRSVCILLLQDNIRQYQCLCQMVQLINKIFSRFVFVMYITFLLISCLIYYLYLFLKGLHGLRIILLCLIIFFSAVISCSSLTAADVAQAAYKPQSSIYRLIIYGKISPKEQIKMHTVMKGLMVNKVGISCMDFFILTRNGILKVFTTLVSYVLILVQVQQLDIEEEC